MEHFEIFIAALFFSVAGLNVISRWLDVPYPIPLVLGGVALGLVPGIPEIELEPDLVLVIFLPPLLYAAAFFSDLRALRSDLRSISLLSIGLVLVTMAAVAVLAHEVIGLTWPMAFALGAIVSPTDPVAATAIMRRLGAPRRLVNVIEGESLVNDATALVAYRVAVGAAVGGSFSALDAGLEFVGAAAGGIGIGLSGVLAAVTTGLYLGWRAPEIASPQTRLQGFALWEILVFLLNATLFILIGLQLPVIVDALQGRSAGEVIGYSALVCATVVAVRFAWLFTVPYAIRAIDRRPAQRERRVGARQRVVTAWAGIRGAVSLAAALALPFETDAGTPLPDRDLILFITFAVILVTLVGQGLTLPALIRRLGVREDGAEEEAEEVRARLEASRAALARLDELVSEEWTHDETIERVRGAYQFRQRRFRVRAGKLDDDGIEVRSLAYQRLMRELYVVQRRALVELRNSGVISNDVMHRVERELDLEESRLEV